VGMKGPHGRLIGGEVFPGDGGEVS
jgi:hypothetical protein